MAYIYQRILESQGGDMILSFFNHLKEKCSTKTIFLLFVLLSILYGQNPQESVKPKPEEKAYKTVTVYITRTGSKYHRAGCRYLSKSMIPISLEEAAISYGPCSVCNPPILERKSNTQSSTILKSDTTDYKGRIVPKVAENGTKYGEISKNTGRSKDVYVKGYYRKDGTYVKGHYRSKPRKK